MPRWEGNPLWLTLAVLVADERRRCGHHDLPLTRHDLMAEAVAALLCPRDYDPNRTLTAPADAVEHLERAALRLHEADHADLADLAHHTGLLVEAERRRHRDPVRHRFAHRQLREHLAGAAILRAVRKEGLSAWQGYVTEATAAPATWAEVLAAAVGALAADPPSLARRVAPITPSTLITAVQQAGSPDLTFRVVAEADGLDEDTVAAVLGMGGAKDWEARTDILQRVPALVGDLAVAARLLDQHRRTRRPRHGAELFRLREVWLRIARGEEGPVDDEVRAEAEAFARRVFDHIPDAERRRALDLLDGEPEQQTRGWRTIPPEVDRNGREWTMPATFRMGSTPETAPDRIGDEGPAHEVKLAHRFEMNAVPVTWEMYGCFDPNKPHPWADQPDAADHPVVNVTWYEAAAFAAWLCCRLPTEEEWEFACRAGTTTRFWSGSKDADLFDVDWVGKNSGGRTHAVATPPKPRGHDHPFGLYDLHGNAWEWCANAWTGDYAARANGHDHDPVDPVPVGNPSERRPVRGGGWRDGPLFARSAYRFLGRPGSAYDGLGFRLVRLPLPPAPGSGL
jgi:hypothetical protein